MLAITDNDPFFTSFPTMVTARLRLTEITPDHAQDLLAIYSDQEVMKFYDVDPLTSEDQVRYYINHFAQGFAHQVSVRWGICRQNDPRVIGTCGFFNWSKKARRAEITYELVREFWNQGIMTEALKCILDFGFTSMNLQRIEAYVEPENLPSRRLLTKLGFIGEEVLEEFAFYKDKCHRFLLYHLDK